MNKNLVTRTSKGPLESQIIQVDACAIYIPRKHLKRWDIFVSFKKMCFLFNLLKKCMSCHKATMVVTGRTHCFHHGIHITPVLPVRDLSFMNHFIIYINIYICIYIYTYIYISTQVFKEGLEETKMWRDSWINKCFGFL